ncbi:hypothetical protein ACKKBG_A19295 [Auxenochlorella protothecoides x Auxenochlorella symbiontica]
MSKGLDLTSWSAGFHSQRALLKDGEEKAQEHVGKGGDPQTNKGHKMYEQDKTAGGAYGDRDDPSAQGVQGRLVMRVGALWTENGVWCHTNKNVGVVLAKEPCCVVTLINMDSGMMTIAQGARGSFYPFIRECSEILSIMMSEDQAITCLVAGVQPTEGRDTSDIVQEDTAAINVTPAESGNAEGGSPMDKSKDSSESVLGVQPSGGG